MFVCLAPSSEGAKLVCVKRFAQKNSTLDGLRGTGAVRVSQPRFSAFREGKEERDQRGLSTFMFIHSAADLFKALAITHSHLSLRFSFLCLFPLVLTCCCPSVPDSAVFTCSVSRTHTHTHTGVGCCFFVPAGPTEREEEGTCTCESLVFTGISLRMTEVQCVQTLSV